MRVGGGMATSYYHCSPRQYGFPSFQYIDEYYHSGDRPVKCLLGLYVASEPFTVCGQYVYRIELWEPARIYRMPLSEMVEMYNRVCMMDEHSQPGAYIEYRTRMARDYDLIEIVEHDSRVGESVIIDLDAICVFERCV